MAASSFRTPAPPRLVQETRVRGFRHLVPVRGDGAAQQNGFEDAKANPRKVAMIASHHRQVMDQGGGGDQLVQGLFRMQNP